MRIRDLEYHSPDSLADACRMLHSLGPEAKVIAGGTDLLADLKQGLLKADHLISLAGIQELKKIEFKNGGLWIGSLVTLNELAGSNLVRKMLPGLSEAGASMAGRQIRNLGTIGGNICSAVPSADIPPSLFTVEAELFLTAHDAKRMLPIARFFLGPRKTAIRQGEILTGIFIPALPQNTGTAYEKFQVRDACALAVVGAAARLSVKDSKIVKALVVLGAVAPAPLFIESAGEFLEGKKPLERNFSRAGELAWEGVKPITDVRGSEEYRRDLSRVLTERALKKAFERI